MSHRRRGFTLTEVLIVTAFLGALAAIAVPHFTTAIDKAAAASVVADARSVKLAMQSFLQAGGTLPPSSPSGQAPSELPEYLEPTMTFSRGDAVYRFVSQPLSGTAQLWVDYPPSSGLGQALQGFRQTGEVTWTPTRTTFHLVK